MKLKMDSIGFLSSNPSIKGYSLCFYDDRKSIHKIIVNTLANTSDSNKLRNIVTGTNVYYYKDEMVIKIEGNSSFNNKVDSGSIYYDKAHFIYSNFPDDDSKGNEVLRGQAMQYYYYFLKRI
jgi:hypothetical protein